MESQTLALLTVFAIGLALGAGYAAALWMTVRRLPRMRYPAFWLVGSAGLRLALLLAGLFLVMDGHWERLLIALLGFVAARAVATHLAGSVNPKPPLTP